MSTSSLPPSPTPLPPNSRTSRCEGDEPCFDRSGHDDERVGPDGNEMKQGHEDQLVEGESSCYGEHEHAETE